MVWVTIDLCDGKEPLGFSVKEADEARLRQFMADCHADKLDATRYRRLRIENAKPSAEGSLFVGYDNEQGGCWVGCDLDAAIDGLLQEG